MPATLVSGKVNMQIDAILTQLIGVANVQAALTRGQAIPLSSGVGANQVDKVFSETRTIAASGTFDYDLSGVLLDAYGSVCSFARVKAIAIFADAGNTNNVVLGAAAATQFVGPFGAATHTVMAMPGGNILLFSPLATGWPVVNAASDLLRVTNSAAGTSVLYDIVILGCSA